jgi:hypothetical protein
LRDTAHIEEAVNRARVFEDAEKRRENEKNE